MKVERNSGKMTSPKQRKIVYGLDIYLFLMGLLCYGAFPAKQSEDPVRIAYRGGATGKVIFAHNTHADPKQIGLDCADCHHHYLDQQETTLACSQCHTPGDSEQLPETCNACHDPGDIEGTELPNKTDSLHGQCTTCHAEFDAGPLEADCSICHVK